MNRFILLGLAMAALIPIVLPPPQEEAAPAHESASSATTVKAEVRVTRLEPPTTLKEAMARAGRLYLSDFNEEARCLAQAVYFEARSESLEGQLAVAQVVLNRMRSPFWPGSICQVVFENDHRRHACQFSFACDGLSDTPHNPLPWDRAKLIAAVALSGLWKDVTERATHYHADYVAPDWRHRFDVTATYGRHIFYRDARRALALAAHDGPRARPDRNSAAFRTISADFAGHGEPSP